MQLWFARGSEVTIREQLVTQIILGILSDDLAPGQRLPSTRELARRFRLHPNTVSAGYRQLERERWVEFRHGSGVYVRPRKPELAPSSALALDQLIAKLFRSARELGAPLSTVRSRLRQWLELQPPDHFLLIEPEEELRRIVVAEIGQAVTFPVQSLRFTGLPEDSGGRHSGRTSESRRRAAGAARRPRRAHAAFSVGTNFACRMAASSVRHFDRYCLEMARLLKTGAHHAECRGLPPGRPGISRRAQSELAARAEADSGRGL